MSSRTHPLLIGELHHLFVPLQARPTRDMNGSLCSPLSEDSSIYDFTTYLPFSVIALISCLVTLILVCVLKLHKILVYRLVLYQVLSAMEFSILWIAEGALGIDGFTGELDNTSYVYLEKPTFVINALLLGSMVMKLMFTVWIVIHLFALAVFHKKLQRLEPLYVASSLIIPLMVTAVIIIKGVVVLGEGQIECNIEDTIYIIVFGVLVLTSWLIFTMGTVLCYRACRRRNLVLSEYDKQHKKALCEMLPLLLYPILFLLLTAPIFAFSVLDIKFQSFLHSGLIFAICAPIWSFSTSMFFMCHLCVVRHIMITRLLKIRNALRYNRGQRLREEGLVTVNETPWLCQRSDTHYTAPTED